MPAKAAPQGSDKRHREGRFKLSRRAIRFKDVHTAERAPGGFLDRALTHPFFSWAGVRSVLAQHTAAEHAALQEHVRECSQVVEIGVAEGASAIALRDGMNPGGTLYLIDPYHLSRVRTFNFLRRAAKRAVSTETHPKAHWIEAFSHEAAATWNMPIDFLLIDGDHTESAVQQDWDDWHPHVVRHGVVALHDARLFPGGWTSSAYGPVKFVDRCFRKNRDFEWKIIDEVDSLVFVAKRASNAAELQASA